MHVVQSGEHIAQIALKYGYENFSVLWEHPQNAELKSKRGTPFLLAPGDELFIPDHVRLVFSRVTDASHDVVVRVDKLGVHLRLLGLDSQPRKQTPVTVRAEPPQTGQASVQAEQALTTDGEGKVSVEIAKHVTEGAVIIDGFEFAMHIGMLDPIEEDSGLGQRLTNLGYPVPADPDDRDPDELQSAIEEFQCDHGMKVTGKREDVESKIKELHGS
ncbi:MAG: peptidoglycan-binding protein [Myxococcota bacterium]